MIQVFAMSNSDHVCGFALAKMDRVHFLTDAKQSNDDQDLSSIGGWFATISELKLEIVRLSGRSIMKKHNRF